MIQIDGVNIIINSEIDYEKRKSILEHLRFLYTLPKGTCPMNRRMGIDYSVVGKPLEIAKGLYSVAIIEVTEEYEERVNVEEVTFSYENEKLIPKVVVTYNGD